MSLFFSSISFISFLFAFARPCSSRSAGARAACVTEMNGEVNRAVAQRAKAGWLRRNSAVIPRPALAGLKRPSLSIKRPLLKKFNTVGKFIPVKWLLYSYKVTKILLYVNIFSFIQRSPIQSWNLRDLPQSE